MRLTVFAGLATVFAIAVGPAQPAQLQGGENWTFDAPSPWGPSDCIANGGTLSETSEPGSNPVDVSSVDPIVQVRVKTGEGNFEDTTAENLCGTICKATATTASTSSSSSTACSTKAWFHTTWS
jgi:hypothetical protein